MQTQQQPQPGPVLPPPHRLTRSSRERMWAGVAGGMAEYFEIDPVLVRLVWVAAAIFSGGLAILVYIVLWAIMPRDTQAGSPPQWRDWGDELRYSTREFAEEARRFASEVSARPSPAPTAGAATDKTAAEDDPFAALENGPTGYGASSGYSPTAGPDYDWQTYGHPRHQAPRQRMAGAILVGLGLLFLAGNTGLLHWIDWHYIWPMVLVFVGVMLLMRQSVGRR